ncbi:MAG: hypothetical protein KDN19_20345 [Verrucomicrobiae bacterium]|nr:hypothetical protein [Verrucomicrobiae bacterium]
MNTSTRLSIATATLFLAAGCAAPDNFSAADSDGSGGLSRSEVKKALQSAIYANGDPDGDGKISLGEFKLVAPDFPTSRFSERDLNDDGYVTPDELDRYAEKNHTFDRLIETFDSNDDGEIDRAEADIFNVHLMKSEGDNALQKLYHLNQSLRNAGK